MKARILYAGLAVTAVLVASIVIGGMLLALAVLLYHSLAEAGSPGLAVIALVVASCAIAALVAIAGCLALQRVMPHATGVSAATPDQMIAAELARLVGGKPVKLVAASIGIGFVLGLSPRLRRALYLSLLG